MNKLEATSEAKLKGAPPDTDRFWSHDEDVPGRHFQSHSFLIVLF